MPQPNLGPRNVSFPIRKFQDASRTGRSFAEKSDEILQPAEEQDRRISCRDIALYMDKFGKAGSLGYTN